MSDLTTETRIPFSQLHRHPLLAQGRHGARPFHRATLDRWRTRGVGGVLLETMRIGGCRYTTEEALIRFFRRTNGQSAEVDFRTPSKKSRDIESAEAVLAAAGW